MQIAAGYRSREHFLTDLTLDPRDATSDHAGVAILDEDYLILPTIHSAKEQEWRSVFVLNVVDGCIPSDLATGSDTEIEEERRFRYVAMTRARDVLHLIAPQRFFPRGQSVYGDRHVYTARTHFIPDNLLGLFDCTAGRELPVSAPLQVCQTRVCELMSAPAYEAYGAEGRGSLSVTWQVAAGIRLRTYILTNAGPHKRPERAV